MDELELYQPQLKYGKNIFKPGIHDIDINVYHDSAGISRSGITELKKSPLHYWQTYLSKNRKKNAVSSSMVFGDAVHTKIMEPDLFDQRFAISDKFDCRTKAGKLAKYEFELAAQGKKVLNKEDYSKLEAIEKAFKRHPLTAKLLKNAKVEQSLFWIDSESELLCKARPDIWTPNYLVDIKTTVDSTHNSFSYSVRDYNYHIQAAMQIDAIKELTGELYHNFIFIALQTTQPYKPYLYNLGDLEIEHGRKEYRNLLKVLRACFDSNKWDSDRDCVTEINLPPYFFNNQLINNLMESHNV